MMRPMAVTSPRRGSHGGWLVIAFAALALAALAVGAYVLADSQSDQHKTLRDRYAERTRVASSLLDSLFLIAFAPQRAQLAQQFKDGATSQALDAPGQGEPARLRDRRRPERQGRRRVEQHAAGRRGAARRPAVPRPAGADEGLRALRRAAGLRQAPGDRRVGRRVPGRQGHARLRAGDAAEDLRPVPHRHPEAAADQSRRGVRPRRPGQAARSHQRAAPRRTTWRW